MLGLSMRAGRLVSGAFQVEKALNEGSVKLVILDAEISAQSYEKYKELCLKKEVPLISLEAGELSAAIGRPGRAAAAVTDENFARQITDLINGGV